MHCRINAALDKTGHSEKNFCCHIKTGHSEKNFCSHISKSLLPPVIIGIVLSVVFTAFLLKYEKRRQSLGDAFCYGLEESNITITDIKWTEFYNWRNVSFNINGRITVNAPRDTDIIFNDMRSLDCIKEISREHMAHSDGNKLLYYDRITYEIENGNIAATGILKDRDNPIIDATRGCRVGFMLADGKECILGYIPPSSESYSEWSAQQSSYAAIDLTPYLGAFKISRTYDNAALKSAKIRSDIRLSRKDGGLLDCIIENNSPENWEYKATLPALEMWYQGVWIELETGIAYNLMSDICLSKESKAITVPKQVTDAYPYLFPGIYRLVVYGVNDDCAVSESFEI